MIRIKKKQDSGQLINYSEWCSANSYKGWLKMCDGYRLAEKYVTPIQPSLDRYYNQVIVPKNLARKKAKKEAKKAA